MATVLVVDDVASNRKLLADMLATEGYQVATAESGQLALDAIRESIPDLVLLDVLMPGLDGFEVCRKIRESERFGALPVIMVTALDPSEDTLKGFEAGANDFISKPIRRTELLARVASFVKLKELHDRVESQAAQLAALNAELESRVEEEVERRKRYGRLRPFLPPAVCDLLIENGDDAWMQTHRQEIATLFCDLRNFTRFVNAVSPESTAELLSQFHDLVGGLVFEFGGTIDHLEGDGVMAFFNDPVVCDDPVERAAQLALRLRCDLHRLLLPWQSDNHALSFGMGISLGEATIGLIRSKSRADYIATGSSVTLAARLCALATDQQILVCPDTAGKLGTSIGLEFLAHRTLKGFAEPIPIHNIQDPST